MAVDQVKFMKEYIRAIRNRITTQDLANRLGISYVRVLQIKKKISDLTGKQLPPLVSPRKNASPAKISKLVASSYVVYKRNNGVAKTKTRVDKS